MTRKLDRLYESGSDFDLVDGGRTSANDCTYTAAVTRWLATRSAGGRGRRRVTRQRERHGAKEGPYLDRLSIIPARRPPRRHSALPPTSRRPRSQPATRPEPNRPRMR